MKQFFVLCFLFCGIIGFVQGQNGYSIEVNIDGFTENNLYLGYYYGDKTMVRDTAIAIAPGKFVFQGTEKLAGGLYLIVVPPDNNFIQILVDKNEQNFSLHTTADDLSGGLKFTNAPDNERFYQYLNFLGQQRPKAELLQKDLAAASDEAAKEAVMKKLEGLNQDVTTYQKNLVAKYPKSTTALVIQSNFPVEDKTFTGTDEEIQRKRWYHSREHFFDNMDLSDPRLLRTPFLFDRINSYVEKLHFQTPDSLIVAIDDVLNRVKPASETFQYYLIHFLNKFASSKVVGMDAIYVHLALNYYGKGLADWTEPEQLKKIIDNAKELEPLLIGKKAPDILMQKRDGSKVSLYDVKTEYTVVYFWRYDCGHCKESTPYMKDFHDKFKNRGVTLFAVCAKQTTEVPDCWKYIDENDIGDWLHTVDPYGSSRYFKKYDVKTTPQVYVLDKNKEIIMKKIGAEQLEEVMDKIIEINKKEKETAGQ